MRLSKGLRQAYDVQDYVFQAIKTFKERRTDEKGELILGEYDAQALSQLVKAWSEAQDRIRIHRGKPLPGSLRPEKKTKTRTPVNLAVIEPMPGRSDEEPESGQSAG